MFVQYIYFLIQQIFYVFTSCRRPSYFFMSEVSLLTRDFQFRHNSNVLDPGLEFGSVAKSGLMICMVLYKL